MKQRYWRAASLGPWLVAGTVAAAPTHAAPEPDQPPVATAPDGLAGLEDDLFSIGVFPNTEGFMDARLRARVVYGGELSSGVQADYFTLREGGEVTSSGRDSELRRELVLSADLLKWIVPLGNAGAPATPGDGLRWAVEPGLGGTFIAQEIQASGFVTGPTGTVFRDAETEVVKGGASARLDFSARLGPHLGLDLALEGLPLVWASETTVLRTSQFGERPIQYSLAYRTMALRLVGEIAVRGLDAGDFALTGRWSRAAGERASRTVIPSGNAELATERYVESSEDDVWAEFLYSLTYLHATLGVTPGVALGWQRKVLQSDRERNGTDSYKLGLVLEVLR